MASGRTSSLGVGARSDGDGGSGGGCRPAPRCTKDVLAGTLRFRLSLMIHALRELEGG